MSASNIANPTTISRVPSMMALHLKAKSVAFPFFVLER